MVFDRSLTEAKIRELEAEIAELKTELAEQDRFGLPEEKDEEAMKERIKRHKRAKSLESLMDKSLAAEAADLYKKTRG